MIFTGIFVLWELPAQCGGSTMDLLERDHCFDQLAKLLRTAATGNGRTVLISGEAGIGKTALVEQFVSQHCSAAGLLRGACEALFTPRPLGPLYDIATQAQGSLSTLIGRATERPTLFSALLDELQKSPLPTVVVFEDVHWADEATLDLIKFLGRLSATSARALVETVFLQAHPPTGIYAFNDEYALFLWGHWPATASACQKK
jgi:predicted ATPase